MVSVPPQGLTEVDYEAIEAAVTETVRGRWFLNEFARRNRLAETRLLLDAMARLEASVAANQPSLPSVDPSVRLLVQRIKEIAASLDTVAQDMRSADIDDRFWRAVEGQARAIGGLMRSATPAKVSLDPPPVVAAPRDTVLVPERPAPPRLPRADLPPSFAAKPTEGRPPGEDPRVAILSGLDSLTLAKKLALFS